MGAQEAPVRTRDSDLGQQPLEFSLGISSTWQPLAVGTTTGPPPPPPTLPPGLPGTLPAEAPAAPSPPPLAHQLFSPRSPPSTVRVSPPWVIAEVLFGTARKPLCWRGARAAERPRGRHTASLALRNEPDLGDHGAPRHGPGVPGSEDRGCSPEHLPGCRFCSVQETVFLFPPMAGF